MTSLRQSYLGQAWLVLVLALVFGGTLAGVHVGLQGRIEANQRAETLSRIPELILGTQVDREQEVVLIEDSLQVGMSDGTTATMQVAERQIAGHQSFEVTAKDDTVRLGWVVRGSGQGYAALIDILVGLDPEAETVTGLYVLSQKETPALGDAITGEPFRDRFVGAPASRAVEVTKTEDAAAADPSKILALTAATISSQSVCDIVNRTVAAVRTEIRQDD